MTDIVGNYCHHLIKNYLRIKLMNLLFDFFNLVYKI